MRFDLDLLLNCIKCYIPFSLILGGCAGYAYRVNSKLTSDDPSKKDMHFVATFLTPIWPVYVVLWVFIFILRAALYIFLLILLTIGLVFIRQPFIVKWLIKVATKIGNKLMKANMLLFRLLFPQQNLHPGY
ncbi:MAG TPA: hypothetical protein VLA72_00245 [Anaerolineales bacterium]|nr:hypothetical protein [Anaerolineales bacterium]